MAQVVLGGVGAALGGGVGRVIGSTLGRVADNALIGALSPARQRGPRLEGLRLQSTADGAPMGFVIGRMRVAGQMIWAARFLERRHENGGGKGGPRTVETAYSLSFAVAICEGPIDAVERIWADGRPMDLNGVSMRVYHGGAGQTPDPLIEAIEGSAPAYRNTAYVVFEDLPLGPYGNRPPQLSFEVLKRPDGDGLEEKLEGVCLIPGAGEFVLATEAVTRREGLTKTRSENVHTGGGGTDFTVSLDQLMTQCPNLKRVSLVVGWFGDDLRAGDCVIRPGVESREKVVEGASWNVAGLTRAEAYRISWIEGAPAYGGTPSDDSVRQAVEALKARGLEVTLYPFVFMDIAADNDLPGGDEDVGQPSYPWRGRITGDDGPEAQAQVDAIFGGIEDWGLRRLALHYAQLAAETGADGLLIGSEMRGLTTTRDEDDGFPAVTAFRALAAECRAVVGSGIKISYAADWSEYFGVHRGGDVRFHLDPLWADPVIDYVGIDWYPPLTDWRSDDGGVDGARYAHGADRNYLADSVAGGPGFDWYYVNPGDDGAQVRTPILDTAHGEHWLFRPKDLIGWWSNSHYDRPGGVRAGSPTAWSPGMKPIRLTEFGCAAVDRGGNAPNLFFDPKSSESALPPHSTGQRSDIMQRRALEAILEHFSTPEGNPGAAAYGGRMVEAADAWCWDARPYPAFPARKDVWADAPAWRTGHWLNGRMTGDVVAMIAAVLRRGGLTDEDFVIEGVDGEVTGYGIDRPMRTRDALEPLLRAVDAVIAERDGKLAVLGRDTQTETIARSDLAWPEDQGAPVRADRITDERPSAARVRYIDALADHQTASVVLRAEEAGDGGGLDIDLPVACSAGQARLAAAVALADGGDGESRTVMLGPLTALALEPGDRVAVGGEVGVWRVERLMLDETPQAVLRRRADPMLTNGGVAETPMPDVEEPFAAPFLAILDMPPLPGREADERPLAAAAADPWRRLDIHAGADATALRRRGGATSSATVGRLISPLAAGVTGRWDAVNSLMIQWEGRAPQNASTAAVLAGANTVAVKSDAGWELVAFRQAQPMGGGAWRLSGLLRGLQGTEPEMRSGAEAGATVVVLDEALVRLDLGRDERGLPLLFRAAMAGAPPGGSTATSVTVSIRGMHDRPWASVHLRPRIDEDGLRLTWTPRRRLYGDGWDADRGLDAGLRFRVRLMDGAAVRRTMEVEAPSFVHDLALLDADYPDGLADAWAEVCGWNDAWGWGAAARCDLAA